MPHAGATPAAQAPPPKHRRSFSGIRTSFGLSSSPSLPVISSNSNQSTLNITTPTSTAASHGGRAGVAFGSNSSSNLSAKSTLPSGIRSLRSRFSFGSSSIVPTTPARTASHGSIGINGGGGGGFMAKLPFGSLSRSNSKQKGLPLTSSSTELVSPFSVFQSSEDDEKGPVMRISAFPPSPSSVMSDRSLPADHEINVPPSPSPSPSAPYYPVALGKGIPRSPELPGRSSQSGSNVGPTTQNTLLAPPAQDDRSPSPASRSIHSVQGMLGQ